jgi:hypothetical protein
LLTSKTNSRFFGSFTHFLVTDQGDRDAVITSSTQITPVVETSIDEHKNVRINVFFKHNNCYLFYKVSAS